MFDAEIIRGAAPADPFADGKAGFVIAVEEAAGAPKLTIAPEEGLVRVNVAALQADKPDAKTLEQRVMKLMWRGLGFANGVGYTRMPPCLMKPTDGSLKELDGLGSCCPCPEAFNNLMMGLAARGIGPAQPERAAEEDEEE